jgi:hypothetical protein
MMKRAAFVLALFGVAVWPIGVAAAPINTDTALPVHQGELLWREQVRVLEAGGSGRELEAITVSSVLVYGVTARFALIGVMPYLAKTLAAGGIERGDTGVGDSTLLGRYQVFQLDRRGETLRAQILGGIKLPTGRDDARDASGRLPRPLQLGSGSYDSIIAGVFSWQRLRWQADLDFSYKRNTGAGGYRFGDTFAGNAAFQSRLWPRALPDQGVPSFVYGVVELNGLWSQRDEAKEGDVADSGGYSLFFSPGLQYVTSRWVIEVSVQLPVGQKLRGRQLKVDQVVGAGFRLQF